MFLVVQRYDFFPLFPLPFSLPSSNVDVSRKIGDGLVLGQTSRKNIHPPCPVDDGYNRPCCPTLKTTLGRPFGLQIGSQHPPNLLAKGSPSSLPFFIFRIRFIALALELFAGWNAHRKPVSRAFRSIRAFFSLSDIGFKPNSPKLERFEWSTTRVISNRLEFTFGT